MPSAIEMSVMDAKEIPRSNISLKEPTGVFAGCISYNASLQVCLFFNKFILIALLYSFLQMSLDGSVDVAVTVPPKYASNQQLQLFRGEIAALASIDNSNIIGFVNVFL